MCSHADPGSSPVAPSQLASRQLDEGSPGDSASAPQLDVRQQALVHQLVELRSVTNAERSPFVLRIEVASLDDASHFAKLETEADATPFIIPYTLEQHRLYLEDASKVYLRILDNSVIGFILLVLDGDGRSVEFRRIVVGPKGLGIGQRAILLMENFCRSRLSRSRIWLDVFENNLRGQHIYERLGYSKFGESNHEGRRLLLYEKDIAPG